MVNNTFKIHITNQNPNISIEKQFFKAHAPVFVFMLDKNFSF